MVRMKCDVLNEACPSRAVLDRIADKWTALIIHALSDGTLRYGELQRRVGGITQKMLTQTLRSLENDGLVERRVYPVVPPAQLKPPAASPVPPAPIPAPAPATLPSPSTTAPTPPASKDEGPELGPKL